MDRDKGRLRPKGPIATLAFIGSAAVLAALVAATPAWAGKQRNAATAREHAQRGTVAYNLGNFGEAVEEFEVAYKLVRDPALLFNIAQAHRLSGHPERALAAYKAYLRTAPPAARDRKQAEKWRDELERVLPAAPAPAGEAGAEAALAPAAVLVPAPAGAPDAPPPAPPAPAPPSEASTITVGPVVPVSAISAPPDQPASVAVAVEREGQRPAEGATAPSPGLSILEIELGPRFLSRSFDYTSSATAPSGYRLNFTPVLGGSLSLFPAARAKGLLAHLGLLAAVEGATWMRSGVFPTGTSDVVVGVQGRAPAAFGQLSASVAFFRHAFLLKDTPDPLDEQRLALEFPNTTYVGARFGMGGRLNLGGRVVLGLDLGYRWVSSPGEGVGLVRSPEYFPGGSVSYALDAGTSLGVRFSWGQARVGVDHRRYAFGPLRGATLNAAGGTDAYTALSLFVMGEFGAVSRPR